MLLDNGIAVWDVIASCDITGSSDSSIRNVVANDLSGILENSDIPVFWLNGLSKTVGSPEIKLGWIAYKASCKKIIEIQEALEYVADAYLSVSSMAQALSIPLLQDSLDYEGRVMLRLNENLDVLSKEFPLEIFSQVSGIMGCKSTAQMRIDSIKLYITVPRRALFCSSFASDQGIVSSIYLLLRLAREIISSRASATRYSIIFASTQVISIFSVHRLKRLW